MIGDWLNQLCSPPMGYYAHIKIMRLLPINRHGGMFMIQCLDFKEGYKTVCVV